MLRLNLLTYATSVAIAASSTRAIAQPAADVPIPEQTIVVRGRVIDVATRAPIAGAIVATESGAASAETDAAGAFALPDVAVGTTLVVMADGYQVALATAGGENRLDIELVVDGEVIEIGGEAPSSTPGAVRLDRADLSRVPGTGNDMLAALDVLPGVTGGALGPTSFNGVIIRGSAPEDSKILIDGFEVPFLYHAVGFRSILPTETVAGLDYMPGGFDVAYGRASSGIVAVKTRGGETSRGGAAELGVIDGGVLAHGPAGADGSYLVALRRSTVDLVLPALVPDDAALDLATVPRYWDGQARLDLALSSRWTLALSAIGSEDALELFTDDEADPDERFYSLARFARLTADARWHDGPWSATLAVSSMVSGATLEVGRSQYLDLFAVGGAARAELSHTSSDQLGLRDVVTRVGAEANVNRADVELALPLVPRDGHPMGVPADDDTTNRFGGVVWIPDVAAWTSAAAGFGPDVRLTTGVRVDGFLRNHAVAVQPRGELAVKLPAGVTARLAAGAYRRPPEHGDEFLEPGLNPERSTQIVLGAECEPIEGVKVSASAYATERSRLVTRGADGHYHNRGRGESLGGELLVVVRRGDLFGWLSYARSTSTRVDEPGAEERLFDFDQPHGLTVAVSYRLGAWTLGARFRYQSGRPYTPVEGAVYDSDADYYVPVFGDVNSLRYAPHHQVDVRIDRTWTAGPVKLTAFLDVQNVYLNPDIVGYGYNFDYTERYEFLGLPIVPSIGLRGEL